jgi:WD40 repeat protein
MQENLVKDLKKLIADRQVILILGAGITKNCLQYGSDEYNRASWVDLLCDALTWTDALKPFEEQAKKNIEFGLETGDVAYMITSAKKIRTHMGEGEFKKWLKDRVGSLEAHAGKTTALEALTALSAFGTQLATTNYDDVVAKFIRKSLPNFTTVVWDKKDDVEKLIRDVQNGGVGILHLHGHWEDAFSIILDTTDYAKILADKQAQNVQQYLKTGKSFVFVGCGDTILDPNFMQLFEWCRELMGESVYRNYHLVREEEVEDTRNKYQDEDRTIVISYGAKHDDLGGFLLSLVPEQALEDIKKKQLKDDEHREYREKPIDDLLARVLAIKKVTTEFVGEPQYFRDSVPPYAVVTVKNGTRGQLHLVGCWDGAWNDEAWQAFKRQCRTTSYFAKEYVVDGCVLPETTHVEANAAAVDLRTLHEYQDLIDFSQYREQQLLELQAEERYESDSYVPQRLQQNRAGQWPLLRNPSELTKPWAALDAFTHWIGQSEGFLGLILADFGSGKTFLMREIAKRLLSMGSYTPVLINMRELQKDIGFDSLIAQHLANSRYRIRNGTIERFNYMLEEGKILLLFDGFDELENRVTYANATIHFNTILSALRGRAKILLTSRKNHFLSDDQLRTIITSHTNLSDKIKVLQIEKFDRDDIEAYLKNRLGDEEAALHFSLIEGIHDLIGLSENPRMLGFIADIEPAKLQAVLDDKGAIYEADLYQLIVEKWLTHETARMDTPASINLLNLEQRWMVVEHIAKAMWKHPKQMLLVEEIKKVVSDDLKGKLATDAPIEQFTHQIGSGTLLIRDDVGNFEFVHRSILEYLIAKQIAEEINGAAQNKQATWLLEEVKTTDLLLKFFARMLDITAFNTWLGDNANTENDLFRKNLENVFEMLRSLDLHLPQLTLIHNFEGLDRSNEDFSNQDFQNARFKQSQLRLSLWNRSQLRGADFSDADLTQASLMGADLRNAIFTNANLTRAKLIGANLNKNALEKAKSTFGAALTLDNLSPQWFVSSQVNSIAYSLVQNLCVAGLDNGTILVLESNTLNLIRTISAHQGSVLSVAFSPDGSSILSGSFDHTIKLWNARSGQEIRSFKGHSYSVLSVAFSPDGSSILSGSADHTIKLWDTRSGQEIRSFKGYSGSVRSVVFSPDGSSILSGSADHTIKLWDTRSGQEIRSFKGHSYSVLSVAFSPDGSSILSGSADHTIKLWDTRSGQEIRSFEGHSGSVHSVAFSPDGSSILSGSRDHTIKLWNARSGECFFTAVHLPNNAWVTFTPDGHYKTSANYQGGAWHTINLCTFPLGELDNHLPSEQKLRLPDDHIFF